MRKFNTNIMTTTWPRELSLIINDYTGYIQTEAQIERDEKIECKARVHLKCVVLQVQNLRDINESDYESLMNIQPSFITFNYEAAFDRVCDSDFEGWDDSD